MKLSPEMRELYDKVPVDWENTPLNAYPTGRTAKALAGRGLIEYRITGGTRGTCKLWQWRRKPGANP